MQTLTAFAAETAPLATGRVLVVGDAGRSCGASDGLQSRGYHVRRGGLGALPGEWADAVIVMTRGLDACDVLELCRSNRARVGPPLLILHDEPDCDFAIAALEAGADDCLLPPHNPREVVARVRALMRRRSQPASRAQTEVRVDGVSFDLMRRRAETVSGHVDLTENQARLLAVLMARPGQVVNRQELLDAILGPDGDAYDRAVDVQICRLKKRLAQISAAELIGSYRGVGYRMNIQGRA